MTRFVWDGWNLLAETDESGNLIKGYIWTMGAAGTNRLLAVVAPGGAVYWVVPDGNRNVVQLLDGFSGQSVADYEYGPFGELLRATGSLAKINAMTFRSQYRDAETWLCYYGYRYYSPSLGRWLSRDPIGEEGGMNLYGMSLNNAINQNDYLGLSFLWLGGKELELWDGRGFVATPDKAKCGKKIKAWPAVSGGADGSHSVPGGWYKVKGSSPAGYDESLEIGNRSEASFWKNGIYWQGTMAAWASDIGQFGDKRDWGAPDSPYGEREVLGIRPKSNDLIHEITSRNIEYKFNLAGTHGNPTPEYGKEGGFRIHPKDRTVTHGCIGIVGYTESKDFLEAYGRHRPGELHVGRLCCIDHQANK